MPRKPPPPPPKKKPVVKKKGGKATALVTIRSQTQAAIFRAQVLYLGSKAVSLQEVWEHGQMSEDQDSPFIKEFVAFPTLRVHATDGRWQRERELFWRDVHAKVLEAAKSAVIKDQIAELEGMHGLRAIAMTQLTGIYEVDPVTGEKKTIIPAVKPHTFEGMVNAYVRLDNHINTRREAITHQTISVIPQDERAPKAREVPMIEDNMSDEEIAAMDAEFAKRLMLKRAGVSEPSGNEGSEE